MHENVKKAMIAADERSTTLMFRTMHNTARVFKNHVAMEVVKIEKKGNAKFEDVRELVSGLRGREVYTKGDIERGVWSAGLVLGLIDDCPSCDELCSRIVKEAEDIISKRLTSLVVPAGGKLRSKL